MNWKDATSTRIALLSCIALVGLLACGGDEVVVEDDHDFSGARQVIVDMPIEDSLDVGKGDKVDWKKVVPMYDGKVTLKIQMGTMGSHTLAGEAVVFTRKREFVTKAPISPMEPAYTLEWDATANTVYVLKLEGAIGASAYIIRYAQEIAAKDPCAEISCVDGEECQDGQCVKIDVATGPTEACPGGCPKGHYCSKSKGKCIKNLCYGVRCGSGEYCSRGKCKTKTKPTKGCQPKCKSDQICKKNKCVKKPEEPKSDTGPISARVVSLQPIGGGTMVTFNRGKRHNVKKGDTGTIGKCSFRITKVFPTRSAAKCKQEAAQLSGKGARIIRK